MTCTDVQSKLLEWPVDQFETLEPHLSGCPACRDLADRILRAAADVDADLSDFADGGDFAAAWVATDVLSEPTQERRSPMYAWLAAVAVAATLALAATPVLAPDGERAAASPCDELTALEEPALEGALSADAVSCLQEHAKDDGMPKAARVSASRLLLVHLWMSDRAAWDGWAHWHATELDTSDVELLFKLALASAGQDPMEAQAAFRYADMALAERAQWPADVYDQRVNSLHRIRASAALQLWRTEGETYDQAFARSIAQEWLDHSKTMDEPDAKAQELCDLTATPETCD